MSLPLCEMSSDVVEQLHRKIARTLGLPQNLKAVGWLIDVGQINSEQQHLMDDGEPLKEWLQWWVDAGAEIGSQPGAGLVVLQPGLLGKRTVQPISESAIRSCFDSGVSDYDAGFTLVWGMTDASSTTGSERFRGAEAALVVTVDGCGAILISAKGMDEELCSKLI